MKLWKKILLVVAVVAALGTVGPIQRVIAQGMVHLTTFGATTQITGIGYPCTVSCFITLADVKTFVGSTSGTVTLNGATPVSVTNANVTANSVVIFTVKTPAGTVSPNAPNVLTITPTTGFTVGGTASDTSLYNYVILN